MDNPFRGEVSVTPAPLQQVYTTLMLPSDAVDRSLASALIARRARSAYLWIPRGRRSKESGAAEAYYGESFVLDTAYIAGYEPIHDASGHVIGIYSTG